MPLIFFVIASYSRSLLCRCYFQLLLFLLVDCYGIAFVRSMLGCWGAAPFAQRDRNLGFGTTRQNILGGCPPSQYQRTYASTPHGSLKFPGGTFRIDFPKVDEGEALTKIEEMCANQKACASADPISVELDGQVDSSLPDAGLDMEELHLDALPPRQGSFQKWAVFSTASCTRYVQQCDATLCFDFYNSMCHRILAAGRPG